MTVPKSREDGLAPRVPTAAVPVPDTGIASVVFEALETTVRVPFEVPELVGANFTLKLALCPEARVAGAVMPVRVYPAPLMLACETVMLELPLLITVPEMVWLLPTVTLPKLMLERFAPRVPGF